VSALSEITAIYRSSKKARDINWFTEHIARPPAAIVVYAVRDTRITPNQVTFISAVVAAGAAALFALDTSYLGLLLAAIVFELSFVLDCADGQLARLRKVASPIGHLLDFMMDELKAMLIYACVAVRLWQQRSDPHMLVYGLLGLFCLASGLTLTSFTRRPEYGAKPPTEDGQPAEVGGRRGALGKVVTAVEYAARHVVHYPQYIWFFALIDRIDIYFWAYGLVNLLYLGKTLAAITLRLGRFS